MFREGWRNKENGKQRTGKIETEREKEYPSNWSKNKRTQEHKSSHTDIL